jgi:hypothetical protein
MMGGILYCVQLIIASKTCCIDEIFSRIQGNQTEYKVNIYFVRVFFLFFRFGVIENTLTALSRCNWCAPGSFFPNSGFL